MKKILFLSGSLNSGGAERQMVSIACLLKKRGYNISFVCYSKGDFYDYLLEKESIPVYWKIADNNLKTIWMIRRFIRQQNFDVVVSFLAVPNFLNIISSLGPHTWKVITGERSSKTTTFLSLKGKLFGWLQRYSDCIVCNSNNAINLWSKYYPNYTSKLITIYNTVTLGLITTDYKIRPNNKLYIVVAASYQHLKNLMGLLKALALMNQEEKEKIKIDWYGRIDYAKKNTDVYDESKQFVFDNNLQDVICLHDATKNISNRMNEADVIALFSSVEGLPNVICEGMLIGKPIIMSKVSDYSVLVDSSNGFLCEWDDITSIKETILAAANLTNPQLIEMGKKSKEKAEKLFSSEIILKNWIDQVEY